jgi:hypothetical protein
VKPRNSKSVNSVMIGFVAILSFPWIFGCSMINRLLAQTSGTQHPPTPTELAEGIPGTPRFQPIPRPAGLVGGGGLIAYNLNE